MLEYVEGTTWDDWVEQGQTPAKILSAIERILEAVAYAHSRGVVHCDLEPSNIVVADNGLPKVRFRDCDGTVFTQTLAPGARPFVQTCMSRPYRAGSQTFTRSFSIGGRLPNAGTVVLFDPEVVIEEAAAP